jgi:hypothetical protein
MQVAWPGREKMKLTEESQLWRLLGRREAFGIIAARCSAAEAVQIKEIRDTKAYLTMAKDWPEFSKVHLHMSYDNANRIIRNLEEFGPAYFEVTQFTRISPTVYRAIAPSIRDQALHHNGEAIALIPENARKVVAAVSELRKTITVKPAAEPEPAPAPDTMATLHKLCVDLILEVKASSNLPEYREQVVAAVRQVRSRLAELLVAM